MAANKMIFSLDIGSSKIVAMVGSIGDTVEVCGVSSYYFTNNSKANDFLSVNNGVVCNIETIGTKVTQALNEARINADCSSGSVLVNISGNNLRNIYGSSTLELNNSTITFETMQQLINGALQVQVPANYEVLDYEVQEYLLDKENYAINPIHLSANSISSNVNTFIGGTSQVANLQKLIRYSGFSMGKVVPSGILSGMSVLNNEEKELGCCLIDIGAGSTDVVVYENGFIRYLWSIPVGGENITKDIALVLKISRNLAEDIKINYGGCSYASNMSKSGEGISITDHRGINTIISRKLLIDVINERVRDIFEVVKNGLNRQKIYDIMSSGIVITGGTSLLPNLEELAKQQFAVPVRLGVPNYDGDFADLVASPKFATCLGSLYFAREYMMDEIGADGVVRSGFEMKKIMKKIKGLFSR